MGVLKVLKNLFFEPENSTKSEPSQKKINITDFFFEESKNPNSTETDKKPRRNFFENLLFESSPENSSATILASDDEISILDDIPSQIKCMKSELKNLAEFFKTVKPKDYPDSVSEYTAYMSLIKQLENITSLVKTSQSQASNPVTQRKIQTAFEKFK